MNQLIGVLAVLFIGGGIWLAIAGLRPAPAASPRRSAPPMSAAKRRQLALMAGGLVVGFALWAITGYLVAVLAIPALVWLAPRIIPRSGAKEAIQRLDAMAEWARSLTGVLGAGASIEQAIVASRSSVPDALKTEVGMLAARLQAGIPTEAALESFGDELDDPTGDLLAGSLILGSRRRGTGLARILESTADTITDDVAARRLIEADRAKPRSNARLISIIAVLAISAEFLVNPGYVAPYRTPIGQIILVVLIVFFLITLWWMNASTRSTKQPRILRGNGALS